MTRSHDVTSQEAASFTGVGTRNIKAHEKLVIDLDDYFNVMYVNESLIRTEQVGSAFAVVAWL
jgi:hypothetical protein